MDFDEGMIEIRSFEKFCNFYNGASGEGGWAIVAYQVNRLSSFYSKGSPALGSDDQKIVVNKKSFFSRVHYALIHKSQEGGVSIEEILNPRTWYRFSPILSKDHKRETSEQPMHIVSLRDAQRSYGHNFVFNEKEYADEARFDYSTQLDAPRERINVLKTKDDLQMRATTAADAQLLLKLLETQKVSLGWQDQGLIHDLKKIFEQEYGFGYESRDTIKQKNG